MLRSVLNGCFAGQQGTSSRNGNIVLYAFQGVQTRTVGVGVKAVQIGRSETGTYSGTEIASRLTVRVITAGKLSP